MSEIYLATEILSYTTDSVLSGPLSEVVTLSDLFMIIIILISLPNISLSKTLFLSLQNSKLYPYKYVTYIFTDHCISELSSQLCKAIAEEGHKTDRDMDEKISLEHQFVQLLLVDNTVHKLPRPDTTPAEYLKFLRKVTPNATCKDILLSRSKGIMVLLRGRAGIGKTTLVQWLLHEWAHQRWAAEKSCAFMLNLRYLMVYDYKMTLRDLLTKCSLYCPDGDHPQLSLWMKHWQEKLLIFLGTVILI